MTDLPNFRLDGKVALVTGASSGLGLRFAKVLAKAGASVALAARRTDRLAGIEREIEAEGGKAISLKLDVTSARSVVDAFEATEGALGPVDILINNAGMNIEARAVDLPETEYDRMMDTNVKGAFLMAQQAAKRMIARKAPGRIVNIASIGAFTVLPGLAVYCMSKAAIAMMTRALAREWGRKKTYLGAGGLAGSGVELAEPFQELRQRTALAEIAGLGGFQGGTVGRGGEIDAGLRHELIELIHFQSVSRVFRTKKRRPGLLFLCRVSLRSELGLGLFGERRKSGLVEDGQIGQHLAVHFDGGLLQAVHEAAVGQADFTRGGVDTGDPQGTELALALTTVAVSVLAGLHDRLLGDPIYVLATAAIALGLIKDLLVTGASGYTAFNSGHCVLLNQA